MQNKVAFVTTAHLPDDDRIYYHLATSLTENNYETCIICSTREVKVDKPIKIMGFLDDSHTKTEKIDRLFLLLRDFIPDIIICSEPLPILAAWKYKRKVNNKVAIIYDITEWYPSYKNLQGLNSLNKMVTFCKLCILNLFASFLANAFIFGEHYKSIMYKIIFPFKKTEFVGYYPRLEYINYYKPKLYENQLCLGYTGKLSKERGFENFINVVKILRSQHPKLNLRLKIVGWFSNKTDENLFRNQLDQIKDIQIELLDYQEYTKLATVIQDVNIFFDLREMNFVNRYCLPIKLFFYMACGRTVIYSNLNAIKRELDVLQFGYLVNPKDGKLIADCIMRYVNNPSMYYDHCVNARGLAETLYNWKNIEPSYLKFIANFYN